MDTNPKRRHRLRIVSVSIVLFALLFNIYLNDHVLSSFQFLKYPLAATNFLNARLSPDRQHDFSPLYLCLHITARRIFPNPLRIIIIIQILLLSLSAAILFRLFIKFFPLWLSLIGTAMFIFYRSNIIYAHTFEPETIFTFSLILFIYFCQKEGHINCLLAGIFLSINIATRQNFLFLFLIIPFYFWMHKKNLYQWFISSVVFVLPIFIVVGIMAIRNGRLQGHYTPVFMNPGYIFFEGNNPNSVGQSAVYPPLVDDVSWEFNDQADYQHEVYRLFARRITGENLDVMEVNSFWIRKAMNFIIDHPSFFLKKVLQKITYYFHNFRRHDLLNAAVEDSILHKKGVPTIPFAFISSLAIIGMLTGVKRWRSLFLFYLIIFYSFTFLIFTYVSERQRLAILAVFLFFSLEGIFAILRKYKIALILFLILFIFLFIPNDLMDEESHLWENHLMAKTFYQKAIHLKNINQMGQAADFSSRAVACFPAFIETYRLPYVSYEPATISERALNLKKFGPIKDFSDQFDYATIAIEAKSLTLARKLFLDLANKSYRFKRDFDQSSQPLFYISQISETEGNRHNAIETLKKAIYLSPGDPWILSHLYVLTGESSFKNQLFRYFDEIDAEFFLGKASLELGRSKEAVGHFQYVVQKIPEYRKGWIYLAASLGDQGNYAEGVSTYLNGLNQKNPLVILENQILELFRRFYESNKHDSKVIYQYGCILRLYGHFHQALTIQREALKKDPLNMDAKHEIDTILKDIEASR